jgi:hypothetical protein
VGEMREWGRQINSKFKQFRTPAFCLLPSAFCLFAMTNDN